MVGGTGLFSINKSLNKNVFVSPRLFTNDSRGGVPISFGIAGVPHPDFPARHPPNSELL